MKKALLLGTTLICLYGITQTSYADEAEFDIAPKFRAKIAKEKAKQASMKSRNNLLGDSGEDGSECGSQSIGNVNTNGRPGSGPREIFVFAPNAINLVSGRGCK